MPKPACTNPSCLSFCSRFALTKGMNGTSSLTAPQPELRPNSHVFEPGSQKSDFNLDQDNEFREPTPRVLEQQQCQPKSHKCDPDFICHKSLVDDGPSQASCQTWS